MINGHGDDLYRYPDVRINFSSNVYAHFSHQGLLAHLAHTLPSITNYPEPSPLSLEKALADELHLEPQEVMVTAGATEAIYLVAQTFRGSHSAILQPTFAEYADACRIHDHRITPVYETGTLLSGGPLPQLMWICNPGNPTGAVLPRDVLFRSIQEHPDTLFVLDASYAPFTRERLIQPTEAVALPNVLMLHSMTKEFAIPGLRLGYVTGAPQLLQRVRLQRMPWSVNQLALSAGHYLLAHRGDYALPLSLLLSERERVAGQLSQLGVVDVWPSQSHILLCRLRIGRASDLKDYLATEHGILIRDASNFPGLQEGAFRIAVQTPQENDVLLSAIQQWIAL